jgi:hypothetical protein
MNTQENQSGVARLRQRIAETYEAAMRGLHGCAYGSAKRQFITRSVEQMGANRETLRQLVGEQKVTRMQAQTREAL